MDNSRIPEDNISETNSDSSSNDASSNDDAVAAPETLAAVAALAAVEAVAAVEKKKKKKKKKKKAETGLGSSRGVETMFRTAYRTHLDLTALADAKANIMISINGLILSIILASIAPKIDTNNWLFIPTVIVLLSCLIAIIYAVLAARPRVNSTQIDLDKVRNNSTNILFFGNYTSLTEDDYVEGIVSLLENTDNLYYNMMRDIYGMGQVLTKKFNLLRKSYTFFMYGLTVSVLSYIVIFMLTTYFPSMVGA